MNDYAQQIKDAIDKKIEAGQEDRPRSHLGASLIGRQCSREIWYSFRWAKFPKHGARMLRLFNRGHREEQRFEEWLTSISDKFWAVHPETGEQFRVSNLKGYFGGSLDGIVKNPAGIKGDFLTEFKTHSVKSFDKLVMQGVKVAKPEHYVQMQIYLYHYPKLAGAIYMAIRKNDDELYVEYVERDNACAEENMHKAATILKSESPPAQMDGAGPFNFYCKYFCDFTDTCLQNVAPQKSCRSCEHIRLTDDGWLCSLSSEKLNSEQQFAGCDQYKRLF